MSKFIKCWVFIICLLFIFLILFTDNVNAEVCEELYTSEFSSFQFTDTANLGNNIYNKTFNNLTISSSSFKPDKIKGQLYYAITTTNDTYTSNVDWTTTCQNVTDYTTTYGQSYTITYADGSTAIISGRNQEIDYVCNNLRTQGALTHNFKYEPEITTVGLYYRDNVNNNIICTVQDNGMFECPIGRYTTYINRITFSFTLSKYQSANIKYGLMIAPLYRCISDEKAIDNSIKEQTEQQHNDAQQQHNDLQQQYNFISNSTIDSNTTSNVNNIDVANSDTKLAVTNFALIPLNFMQSIINSFSSSCSQVCIGNCGSGHDNDWRFVFPCLDFDSILGSNLYTIIDSLFAFGMVFAFIRSVRKFFINALLLTTDASSEVGVFL